MHALILLAPVTWKCGMKLYEERNRRIAMTPHENIKNCVEADIYIRTCMRFYDMDYQTYLRDGNGYMFEVICQNH